VHFEVIGRVTEIVTIATGRGRAAGGIARASGPYSWRVGECDALSYTGMNLTESDG
jgi:hypothetical protein